MSVEHCAFVVLGAGTAGYNAAVQARELGKSVALVDGSGDLAGLCILRGCMPAKTVLHSADVAHEVAEAGELGVETRGVRIDPAKVVARKRRLVEEFKEDRLRGLGEFPLFRGQPRFVGDRCIEVAGTTVTGDRVLIATGSTIQAPRIPGLDAAGCFTSDAALEMTHIPHRVVTLGGGPVGCEFSQYFARMGAQVTIVESGPQILRAEDDDVARAVREALEGEGIRIITHARVERVERDGTGRAAVIHVDGREERVCADGFFLATGRGPNVQGFGFERTGVEYGERGIRHDEYLQTTNPNVYAAGDVLGRRCLVHGAEYGGKIAAKNAFCDEKVAVRFELFDAHSVATQPEIGIAGLTERAARERFGPDVEVASYPFHDHGRALTLNLPQGFVKVVASGRDGTILGVTFVGGEAVDLIAEANALLYYRAKVTDVLNLPHLHPTMTEIITYPCEEISKRLSLEREIVYY